jgi:hypothetical protein
MTADSRVAIARCAVRHARQTDLDTTWRTTLESWVDLLLTDEEWVRREFGYIGVAGWGGAATPSPAPIRGSQRPQSPG